MALTFGNQNLGIKSALQADRRGSDRVRTLKVLVLHNYTVRTVVGTRVATTKSAIGNGKRTLRKVRPRYHLVGPLECLLKPLTGIRRSGLIH